MKKQTKRDMAFEFLSQSEPGIDFVPEQFGDLSDFPELPARPPQITDVWGYEQIISEEAKDRLDTNKQIREHRQKWSNWLLGLIIFTTLSITGMVYLLGFGIMNISEAVMKYIIVEGLIRVFALATIVVAFLFNDKSTKSDLKTKLGNLPQLPKVSPIPFIRETSPKKITKRDV